ncbi:E3 ubiquitin-protein ligase lubel isoform X2 [Battus philenor]|uniref:E3 ubiquitin-protein ligase lubel isoform X2 n=1 Tax=Battus philenor TaxID=42288 RepID=UPI0035D107E5
MMLKGRGRDPRGAVPPTPTMSIRSVGRPPMAKPEPDYEVVEFPTEQYVNAKLQPPPPPPPRPPTGHPLEAGASCGLCGGGGARVRCAECGRRALCASCDDMYHRHPKRRHHQRQALSLTQLNDVRPPLPPKTGPPVPPPRKHKIAGDKLSASPSLSTPDQRRATLTSIPSNQMAGMRSPVATASNPNHFTAQRSQAPVLPAHLQMNVAANAHASHLGSLPYLSATMHHAQPPVVPSQEQSNTLGHVPNAWNRQRSSLPGFIPPNMAQPIPVEPWDTSDTSHSTQSWGRPLRRGTSVMELGVGPPSNPVCGGCPHCLGQPWRYGSCASLDHTWAGAWAPNCCVGPHIQHQPQRLPLHPQVHPAQTPQSYRRAESRPVSRVASRAGSRAASPAMSVRSRTSRRPKHRTPSPPPLPSSDADSESEESDRGPAKQETEEERLGPPPSPPSATWQCEHCTYVNEPGVRVCVVCCRTPTISPRLLNDANIKNDLKQLKISDKRSPSVARTSAEGNIARHDRERSRSKIQKERISTACGPSPPKEEKTIRKPQNRLETPTRDEPNQFPKQSRTRHDMAVGPSPPKESTTVNQIQRENTTIKTEDGSKNYLQEDEPKRRSVSVGPSPPGERKVTQSSNNHVSSSNFANNQKKSTGTSPPRETRIDTPSSLLSSTSSRANVSNTGTSPPPQSISTQTYDVATTREWERAPSACRSRARRRLREEGRRERSHSRHSLSSDTRESERSVRTSGGSNLVPGRWEWREPRDSSPGGEWSGSERHRSTRLSRRASHLDLRRTRTSRRSSVYGSEAPSPEPFSGNRAVSLEVLASNGARRETERGLELARLMGEAEKLGFSAAEVHAALAQNPAAPLAWLRERWPSLCAGVRAAAVRLAPGAIISERDARTALARHRGAMWPAVTDCVEKWRRQRETIGVESEGRLRGHVWGSPTGVDDDAAPPTDRSHRIRADESSDELELPSAVTQDDDWMYLPLENNTSSFYENFPSKTDNNLRNHETEEIAKKLKSLLIQAGIPNINEQFLLKGLLSNHSNADVDQQNVTNMNEKQTSNELVQSENDFIDAYNALTRLSPLPNIGKLNDIIDIQKHMHRNEVSMTEEKIISNFSNNESKEEYKGLEKSDLLQLSATNNRNTHTLLQIQPTSLKNSIDNFETPVQKHASKSNSRHKLKLLKLPNGSQAKNFKPKGRPIDDFSDSQEDGKPNNLNEIVDNTQKLIQQMKKELNSDIKSLGSNSSTKRDSDDTSNDSNSNLSSEKESSYSDTENETDDLSSDDNENEQSDIEDTKVSHNATINRTSSEDNEQFEEAIDHIENQIDNPHIKINQVNSQGDNFKMKNIEILDSIAKSLQEDHSLSVQALVTNVFKNKQQDINNNLFSAVNSFEEIYEQLTDIKENGANKLESTSSQSINNREQQKNSENPNLLQKLIGTKEEIKYVDYNPQTAANILLTEISLQLHNAILKDIHNDTKLASNNLLNMDTNNIDIEIINSKEHLNTQSKPPEIISYSYENNDQDSPLSTVEHTTIQNITNESFQPQNDVSITEENKYETKDNEIAADVNLHQNNTAVEILENTVIENDQLLHSESKSAVTDVKIDKPISTETSTAIKTNFSFNKGLLNKSNIPKLVKALQSNKLKVEKTSSKVLSSKVPVRRTSIKHYPAPAPPNPHFGKIQNGHVKQLQTKLLNNKSQNMTTSDVEVLPSTSSASTLTKKKPAPLPPTAIETKQQSPPKEPLEKDKNQYFRETCRTEDEWTESDSEVSQSRTIAKHNSDTEPNPLSPPPPPITMRRVSGHLIDLATIRLPEGSPERQARMLLAEGATENWNQAQLAVELIARGVNPPSALLAALECVDLDSALTYLHQDCELCASRLPEYEMVSMLRCTHRCCRECARHYFTVQITERSIADCVCPYCKEPELENLPEDTWLEYFAHLDILLKTLLDTDVHELFQRKLRDRTLARDPNFKWCVECSSGFFVHPKQKKLRCPECRSVTCASCRKKWSSNHEGLSCEQYTKWLEDNDPERSVAAVQQHLRENGLECPRCHFKYSLSRGGCMHFTCTQCKYEFCYGCGKPFMMGARCGLSEYCAKLGLHAHHPRNCLFYLRDKEPHELQTLLQMNNVAYETEAAEGSTNRCPIQLQRETPTGLVDGACGSESSPKNAGLCKIHYVEYLAGLARNLDPIPIMDVSELVAELRRRALPLPERGPWDTDPIYAGMCAEIVREKIPLD